MGNFYSIPDQKIIDDNNLKVDEKILRQKYLVLCQIKDNKLRLKSFKKKKEKLFGRN